MLSLERCATEQHVASLLTKMAPGEGQLLLQAYCSLAKICQTA